MESTSDRLTTKEILEIVIGLELKYFLDKLIYEHQSDQENF